VQYPPSLIERIKTHFRLSEVIGKRINVRRHGKEYQALCPFHNEKTPSFTISDEKNFYYCFGCGAKGDAITFVMEHDRVSYIDALKSLASDAGIPLPTPDPKAQARYVYQDTLLHVCQLAAQYFQHQLYQSVGQSARAYLEGRGLTPATIKEFSIGYAPMGREHLKAALLQQGCTEQQLIDTGLLIKVEDRPAYDRFRGRVMFPIRRADGKVIAFGGRLMEAQEHAPKYLNSPETALFNKKQTLFNLDKIRKTAQHVDALLVVEGYMDAVMLWQAGIHYAVAPLGTAFSEEHLHLLWKYHPHPILCFDGDKAGQKAMLRAAELALPLITIKHSLRFCGLPSGEDPDSYVRAGGKQAMEQCAARALTMSELLWNCFIGTQQFSSPEALASAEAQLMDAISKIQDAILRQRITSAYKNRLWHMSKERYKQQPVSARPLIAPKEDITHALHQAYATIVHFPALLKEAEVEHALYHWGWQHTPYADTINTMLSQMEYLSTNPTHMADFLSQTQTAQPLPHCLPPSLYGGEYHTQLPEAKAFFHKLQQKIENYALMQELSKFSSSEQLVELIKIQQNKKIQENRLHDDPYI
jgi:DNA primase